MNKSNNSAPQGLGFTSILQLIFITLKLMGVIEWSWVWVLSPLWISVILVILVALIMTVVENIADSKRRRR